MTRDRDQLERELERGHSEILDRLSDFPSSLRALLGQAVPLVALASRPEASAMRARICAFEHLFTILTQLDLQAHAAAITKTVDALLRSLDPGAPCRWCLERHRVEALNAAGESSRAAVIAHGALQVLPRPDPRCPRDWRRHHEAGFRIILANAAIDEGQLDVAREHLHALADNEEVPDAARLRGGLARIRVRLALASLELERADQAGRDAVRELPPNAYESGQIALHLAEAWLTAGEPAVAIDWVRTAEGIANHLEAPSLQRLVAAVVTACRPT